MELFNKAELRDRSQKATVGLFKSASRILVENSAQSSLTKTFDIFLSHSMLEGELIHAPYLELCGFKYR